MKCVYALISIFSPLSLMIVFAGFRCVVLEEHDRRTVQCNVETCSMNLGNYKDFKTELMKKKQKNDQFALKPEAVL